jgi:hypothetical protein
MNNEIEQLKKERDKACKDYLDLYARVDKTKDLLRDLIKKEKFQIEKDNYIFIALDHLGDFKLILDTLERKN